MGNSNFKNQETQMIDFVNIVEELKLEAYLLERKAI